MIKTTDNQKELFVVVDKNDTIIDYRTRKDCHSDKNLIHRAIHIVIVNDKGEILLQRRSKTKDLQPGFYTLSVGGHVTKGETYASTARREMKEELGIVVPITKITKYLAGVSDQQEMVMVYKALHNGPFSFDPIEVARVDFFPVGKVKKLAKQITPISLLTLNRIIQRR